MENKISLFNEVMISFYLYILIRLTDFNEDPIIKENSGLILLVTLISTFFVNIAKMLCQIGLFLHKKLHRYKLSKATIKLKPLFIRKELRKEDQSISIVKIYSEDEHLDMSQENK